MYDFGVGRPNSPRTAAPSGTRLIDSIPHDSATSTTPDFTSDAARPVACCDEPHCASTVVAATSSGMPADSHAVRAMLNVCSPTWETQPPTSWPTPAGLLPVRLP